MSRLLDVSGRIKQLPELQKQKKRSALVEAFTKRIDEAHNELLECVMHRSSFLTVFPDENLNKTVDALKQSKAQAMRLLQKLREDFDEIGKTDTDKKITRIRERNKEAQEQMKKEWKKRLLDELLPLNPLIEIAREAELPGSKAIATSAESLNSSVSCPPQSLDEASKIRDSLNFLRNSLSELKLEGPGGEFLGRAIKGRADAKELLNEEVQEFLNEKDLWGILRLRVG